MAITTSISGLNRDVGTRRTHRGNLTTSGTYETGGFAVTSNAFGLGRIEQLRLTPASGYEFEYIPATGKVKVYVAAGFTPAGTISAPPFRLTDEGFAAGLEIGISAYTNAGIVGVNGVTGTVTLTTSSPVLAPNFTGTAVPAAALGELANGATLAITTAFEAIGV